MLFVLAMICTGMVGAFPNGVNRDLHTCLSGRVMFALTRVVELQREPAIVQETETPVTPHEERAHGVLRGASVVRPAGPKIALAS